MTHQKPRLLVVDDEPDNLDLLYRTFRREYQVLRAESGSQALEVLNDGGEVAVIISDQRMPEMTGTEFLSRTVPDFPDTVRIILTGFTDVEDLVQAINNGQVYRFITKPWDPTMLKQLVHQATDTYGSLKQRDQAFVSASYQVQLMMSVAQLASVKLTEPLALQAIADNWAEILSAHICAIQCVNSTPVVSGDLCGQTLDGNGLMEAAIASQTIQTLPNLANQPEIAQLPLYEATATQAHLVAPVVYQDELLATISLHWEQAVTPLEDVVELLPMVTKQMAQALVAIRS